MIYQTLITPSEAPPRLIDIKRAMLTFDRVFIPDPGDRDIIPPQLFMPILTGRPVSFGVSPVRTLGKVNNYDNEFDQLIETCSSAVSKGIIKIFSSYVPYYGTVIGRIPDGNYPLNPAFVLQIYRQVAFDNDFLLTAINDDILKQDEDYLEQISDKECLADFSFNDFPCTPLIDGEMQRSGLREVFSSIAKGRLGSILKAIGYCAAKDLVPFFSEEFQYAVAGRIVANSTRVIDKVSEYDPYWINRSQALKLAHDEHIDEAILEELSIDDVIKLRSKIWGEQASARDDLMKSVALISREVSNSSDFKKACSEKMHTYKLKAASLERERNALKLKITCDIGLGLAGAAGAMNVGSLAQIQTGVGVTTTLVAGCLFALQKIKEYGPVHEQLKANEQEFQNDAVGFGFHQFYRNIN